MTPKGEKVMYDLEKKINEAVFPGVQGSSHNNTIAGTVINTNILILFDKAYGDFITSTLIHHSCSPHNPS